MTTFHDGYHQAYDDVGNEPDYIVAAVGTRMQNTLKAIDAGMSRVPSTRKYMFHLIWEYHAGYVRACKQILSRRQASRRKSLFCGSKL